MDMIPESKKSHLWRKIVWHTDPERHPLGPHHYAEVYCCQEANGHSVWYVRRLPRDDTRGIAGTENGDYLLAYYGPQQRDEAIERAVLIANCDASPDRIIPELDRLAASARRI